MRSADGEPDVRLIEIRVPAAAAEAAADVLLELGAWGVFTEGLSWRIAGSDVIDERPSQPLCAVCAAVPAESAERLLGATVQRVSERPWLDGAEARLRSAPKVDWAREYERHLRAHELLPGLYAAPPWDRVPGRREIVIEPGAAFGFGDHPTTRTTLRLLARHLHAGADVIDLGCGTGILGAAALLLGAGRARLYDTDALAAQTARRTLRANGLRAQVRHGTLPARAEPADLLLANIAASALRPLLPKLARAVRPGGILVAGGILRDDRDFAEDLRRAGFELRDRETEGDWQAVAAQP